MAKHARKKNKDGKGVLDDSAEASGSGLTTSSPSVPTPSSKDPKGSSHDIVERTKRKSDDTLQDGLARQQGTASRKKRKKRKKNKSSPDQNDLKEPPSGSTSDDEPSPLEGTLVDGQLVLVDRAAKKVYSASERLENGDRKQIGNVTDDGKMQLFEEKQTPVEENSDAPTTIFPYPTEPDDHCESPREAYQDIVPFLQACGNKTPSSLSIYDPYFCNGAVVRNLEALGFPKVYNQKEDCYEVWKTPSKYPSFDVLVTNPPYSGDHIESLVRHITSATFGQRPWLLLLPQWVHKKDYYVRHTAHIRPFYLVPKKRYVYLPPPSFRESKKSDVHKKSSPFVSMWYIWGGTPAQNEKWLVQARQIVTCDVARSKSALRDLRRK